MTSNEQYFAAAFSLAFVAGAEGARKEAAALSGVSGLPLGALVPGVPGTAASLPEGTAFVVRSVEAGAFTATYALERLSDGSQVSVDVSTRGARQACAAAGALVTATAIGTGVVLVAGTQPIAFVPNALGRALLHSERAAPA